MALDLREKNGFQAIYSFEYIGVLDSYFIHRYIPVMIKYRSSSIKDKIH